MEARLRRYLLAVLSVERGDSSSFVEVCEQSLSSAVSNEVLTRFARGSEAMTLFVDCFESGEGE